MSGAYLGISIRGFPMNYTQGFLRVLVDTQTFHPLFLKFRGFQQLILKICGFLETHGTHTNYAPGYILVGSKKVNILIT